MPDSNSIFSLTEGVKGEIEKLHINFAVIFHMLARADSSQTDSQLKRVFVSGCYDILHAGHVQFFTEARAIGDYLTVSFASAEVLFKHKERRGSLPDDHKKALIEV